MKKVALIFLVAVLLPSLVLAWLAIRSLRDEHLILRHQESVIYQSRVDALASQVRSQLAARQRELGLVVESLVSGQTPRAVAPFFDQHLHQNWPLAEIGFVVDLHGVILCPTATSRREAQRFNFDNGSFLGNRQATEAFVSNNKGFNVNQWGSSMQSFQQNLRPAADGQPGPQATIPSAPPPGQSPNGLSQAAQPMAQAVEYWGNNNLKPGVAQRKTATQNTVVPQSRGPGAQGEPFSRITIAEAEFNRLIGDGNEGTMARFLNNQLKLWIWYRSLRDPQIVFGAQCDLNRLVEDLRPFFAPAAPSQKEPGGESPGISQTSSARPGKTTTDLACVALLDDTARPRIQSHPQFTTDWKHPFVAAEIGEALPHWTAGLYFLNPAHFNEAARTVQIILGLVVCLLLLAIGGGSWLIVSDLRRELNQARLKTDFVGNVSHELKTPLTSIRMFSELLAEGRVADPGKQNHYLKIILAESSRLTRLINNVLDFARLERGEKQYHFSPQDVGQLVAGVVETYRPHLEAKGFKLAASWPAEALEADIDPDAIAQVVVNLLSNAEKYANGRQEIQVQVEARKPGQPMIEVSILDRGIGVPKGCESRIFEKFFRAHDSLSCGIPGSGLGLTLARQTARAHRGDVVYEPRPEGGSIFRLRIPGRS